MKNLKGWRTIIVAAVIAGLGAIQATDLVTVIPEQWVGTAMLFIGFLVASLRAVTNTTVGSSVSPVPNESMYDPEKK